MFIHDDAFTCWAALYNSLRLLLTGTHVAEALDIIVLLSEAVLLDSVRVSVDLKRAMSKKYIMDPVLKPV